MFEQNTLAIIFVSLMGLAVLLYAILDGYDLGVGMLLPLHDDKSADTMIASIGPFWDANETWLVLAIGLLLIAFPEAHSYILKELYIPATLLLLGLILRGVAFDFRAKANISHKPSWNLAFKLGSWLASFSQGYMLGSYVTGFSTDTFSIVFAILSGLGVCAAYCFIGATWLVMKTESSLQEWSISIAKKALGIAFTGILLVSLTNLVLNPEIYEKWFTWTVGVFLLPIPIVCAVLFGFCYKALSQLQVKPNFGAGYPFILAALIFVLSFVGLGYSFFPYIVPHQITIWESVAAKESLNFLLYGAVIVVPTILAYTVYSYRVFWGKVQELRYY